MNCNCGKKPLDERKFGLWWGLEHWLVRVRNTYEDMQEQKKVFREMFGDDVSYWEDCSVQFRKVARRQIAEDC